MKKLYPVAIALFLFSFGSFVFAREAKLVRYPSYSNWGTSPEGFT